MEVKEKVRLRSVDTQTRRTNGVTLAAVSQEVGVWCSLLLRTAWLIHAEPMMHDGCCRTMRDWQWQMPPVPTPHSRGGGSYLRVTSLAMVKHQGCGGDH